MGGLGSGRRRYSPRTRLDYLDAIDANEMQRFCAFERGSTAMRSAHKSGLSNFFVRVAEEHISIRPTGAGHDHSDVDVPFTIKACRFGGVRYYFRCPNPLEHNSCDRQVTKLYYLQDRILCRQCTGLAYRSQAQSPFSRNLHRGDKIRIRLGGSRSVLDDVPPRPKGMWRRTYARLYLECWRSEQSAFAIAAALLPSGPKIIETRARCRKSR
jgi:hypothetical protein